MQHNCVVFLFAPILLSSCAYLPSRGGLPQAAVEPLESAGAEDSQPFTLTLLQEMNDGSNIRLAGTVHANRALALSPQRTASQPALSAKLRVTGLSGGDVRYTKELNLSEISTKKENPQTLNVGDMLPFSFSIPVAGLESYNLELVWGEEVMASGRVQVEDIKLEAVEQECEEPPCKTLPRISAMLVNQSSTERSDITLGIGFVLLQEDSVLDLSKVLPENEKKLALKGVVLQPGEQRALKLNLDRAIPRAEQGRYQPVVRVLSAK